MNGLIVVAAVSAVVVVVVLTELAAAAVPLLIVVTLVPPHERAELATLLAACDSSRRLRLWTAMHAAVVARRQQRANRVYVPATPGTLPLRVDSSRVPADAEAYPRRSTW
jgi:hypothetical protein